MKKYTKWIIPILSIVIIGFLIIAFSKKETTTEEIVEYTPAEEISDEQLKRTKVTLYYLDQNTNTIIKDDALINSKDLIDEPSKAILNLYLKSTPLENSISPIAEGTKINKITISKNIAEIDFTPEFFNHNLTDKALEEKMLICIANTLCQLNEITGIKILINGELVDESKLGLNLNQTFLPDYTS